MFHPPLPSPDPFPEVPKDGSHCQARPWRLCAEAVGAVRGHVLAWDEDRKAWYLADAPVRHMDVKRARYFANYEGPDTTGEPYTLTNCPWCGGELPRTAAEEAT